MADIKKVTLKRFNGTDQDTIHPKTEWDQIESKPATFTPTSHTLNSHSDVDATATADGQVLTWDANNTKWIASATSGGGVSKSDLQNLYIYGKASAAITKGQAVQFAGAQGDHILIKPAVPSEINSNPDYMIGIAETSLSTNDFGYVLINGRLNLDTSSYSAGDILYFASAGSTAGALTTTEPTGGTAIIQMAAVSISGVGTGEFVVRTILLSREIHEVIDLQDSLDAKVDLAGDTMTGELSMPSFNLSPSGSTHDIIFSGRTDYANDTTNSHIWMSTGASSTNTDFSGKGANIVLETRKNSDRHIWFKVGDTTDSSHIMHANGNVGIGTTSPGRQLEVNGTGVMRLDATSGDPGIDFNTAGTADMQFRYRAGSDYLGIYSYGTTSDVVSIKKSNGNVGIGTTSPTRKLQVEGGDFYTSGKSDSVGAAVGYGGSSFQIRNGSTSEDLNFDVYNRTSSAWYTPLIIKNTGNVGIGTTSPSNKLHIVGDTRVEGDLTVNGTMTVVDTDVNTTEQWLVTNDGTGPAAIINQKGAQPVIDIQDDGVSAFYIKDGGNVGIGTTSPVSLLEVKAPNGSTGTITVGGGNTTVTTVGEVNAALDFRSNDTSVNNTNNIAGRIASITEITNGAYAGLGFYTYKQGRTPDLEEAMRIDYQGNVLIGKDTNDESSVKLNVWGKGIFRNKLQIQNEIPVLTLKDTDSTGNAQTGYINFWDSNNAEKAWIGFGTSATTDFTIRNAYDGDINLIGGNVGIGTTSPSEKLDVVGNVKITGTTTVDNVITLNRATGAYGATLIFAESGTPKWFLKDDFDGGNANRLQLANGSQDLIATFEQGGNVGIGTTRPERSLHIDAGTAGGATIESDNDSTLRFTTTNGGTKQWQVGNYYTTWNGLTTPFIIQPLNTGMDMALTPVTNTPTSGIVIKNSGNVGIGTTSPAYKLDVSGNSRIDATSAGATLTLGRYSGQPTIKADTDDGGHLIMDSTSNYMSLNHYTNQNIIMALGGGNVGVGVSPGAKLDVNGFSRFRDTMYFGASSEFGLISWNTNGLVMLGQSGKGMAFGANGSNDHMYINTSGNVGIGTMSPGNTLDVKGGIQRTNTRVDSAERYPLGHYTPGETVFEIDPTWSQDELRNFFNSNSVSWSADSTAPGGYAIKVDGQPNFGGQYGSGFPYIPIDQDDEFYMEMWIRSESGAVNRHYLGSNEYNESFSSLGGNPGSFGYWVMSNTQINSTWTKVSGYIGGFSNSVGDFETGTKYWTPLMLANYTNVSGARTSYISGWKVIKVYQPGHRTFDGNIKIAGDNRHLTFGTPGAGNTTGARFLSIEGNTDANGEGSGRIFFTEHNSSTSAMDNYGMSIGYRGGDSSITGASGNTWTGLSQIGNGQWGMWGHNASASGALIMYGDRAATFVNFANNDIAGVGSLTASSGNFSGNVGIGITSLNQKLQVNGAITGGTKTTTGVPNTSGVTTQLAFEARGTQTGNDPSISFHKENIYTMYLQSQYSPRGLNLYSPSNETDVSLFVEGVKVAVSGGSLTYTLLGSINLTTSTDTLSISPSNGLNSVIVIDIEVFNNGATATWTGPITEIGTNTTYVSNIYAGSTRYASYYRNSTGTQIYFTNTASNNVYRARVYELKVA